MYVREVILMTDEEVRWARECVRRGETSKIYNSARWHRLRWRVLEMDHGECQVCRGRYRPDLLRSDGPRYTPASVVHHDLELLKHPEHALDIYYKDAYGIERRNLWSVCRDHHEMIHGYRQPRDVLERQNLTEERWD